MDVNEDNKKEVLHYWAYFCSLCDRLENTRQYVDHGFYGCIQPNCEVNSFEFLHLIILTAVEFESIGKIICQNIDEGFKEKSNIKKISKTILGRYPNIIETEIISDYRTFKPLNGWQIDLNGQSKNKIRGLDWWYVYTSIKHNSFQNFRKARLDYAINALASLLVLELYLMKIKLGNLEISANKKCCYFDNSYRSGYILLEESNLPDFK